MTGRRQRLRPVNARFRERIGSLIKEARVGAGLTRRALAERAGVHTETIRHIEAGRNFEIASLERLVRSLELDFVHLVSQAVGLDRYGELSAADRRLLDAFRNAPDRDREVIRLLLDLPPAAGVRESNHRQTPLPFEEEGA